MALDELIITQAIVERFSEKLKGCLMLDVAIVGAGPSGLVAGYYLAKNGHRVAIFEKKLSIGGGMWGGGMMFNQIVVQTEGKRILDEFEIKTAPFSEGYYTADAIEAITTICSKACQAGVNVFNTISVEDVLVREGRVIGLVINWSTVEMAKLDVDPLTIRAQYVIEATGHATEVVKVIEKKMGESLLTPTGKIIGEKSLWAEIGEADTIKNTKEAYPGLFVCGMAANATFGSYRMGPVFGGMLLSGERVAKLIHERLRTKT
ncbi:MAG: ribulose-1,5-biphosphate synthetase [Syntrophobacter sp. DG_60]|nr:MAG: ribulose-1,5-biphosphate synthetase [Syntrophobacter sp. DG_60]